MGIGFYKPQYFAALIFLGILILIHLLRRPRTVNLKFSTLQFFNANAIKTASTQKIRQLLLLFTRLFLVTLVISLFAGPHFSNSTIKDLLSPNSKLYIWIDSSPSMDYSEGGASSGQLAIKLIDSIASILPFQASIYTYDHDIDDFTSYNKKNHTFKIRHGPLFLEQVLQKMKNHKQFTSNSVMLFISDFQSVTTDEMDMLLKKPSEIKNIICVTLTPDSPWNFSIEKASFIRAGAIDVEVKATGKALISGKIKISSGAFQSVPVKLFVSKDSIANVIVPFDWKENQLYSIIMDVKDPLPFDNDRIINISSQSEVSAIILGNTEDNFVIAAALKASGENFNDILIKECSTISLDELSKATLVIINSSEPCPVLGRILAASASERVILYCIDNKSILSDYIILKRAIPELRQITFSQLSNAVFPVLPDIQSGLFQGFTDKNEKLVKITDYAKPLPGTPICYLSDGGVLFSAIANHSNIQWVFSSIPLGINSSNNFWQSGIFVPMLDRIIQYSQKEKLSVKSIVAGYPVKNPFYNSTQNGLIHDFKGNSYTVPDKKHIIFKDPGIYKIVAQGELVKTISVITDTSESRMKFRLPLTDDSILVKPVIYTQSEIIQMINKRNTNTLFYFPWIIVILFIGIEVLLWERRK